MQLIDLFLLFDSIHLRLQFSLVHFLQVHSVDVCRVFWNGHGRMKISVNVTNDKKGGAYEKKSIKYMDIKERLKTKFQKYHVVLWTKIVLSKSTRKFDEICHSTFNYKIECESSSLLPSSSFISLFICSAIQQWMCMCSMSPCSKWKI